VASVCSCVARQDTTCSCIYIITHTPTTSTNNATTQIGCCAEAALETGQGALDVASVWSCVARQDTMCSCIYIITHTPTTSTNNATTQIGCALRLP